MLSSPAKIDSNPQMRIGRLSIRLTSKYQVSAVSLLMLGTYWWIRQDSSPAGGINTTWGNGGRCSEKMVWGAASWRIKESEHGEENVLMSFIRRWAYESPGKVMIQEVQWILELIDWKAHLTPNWGRIAMLCEGIWMLSCRNGETVRFLWSRKSHCTCDVHTLRGSEVSHLILLSRCATDYLCDFGQMTQHF